MNRRLADVTLIFVLLLMATSCNTMSAGGPEATSSPTAANAAPSFAEIRDNIRILWKDASATEQAVGTATVLGSYADGSNATKQLEAFQTELKGKVIDGWEGWVQQVTFARDGSREIMVDMDEYYERSPFLTFAYRGVRRIGFPDVLLQKVTTEQAEQFAPGQRLRFSGTIQSLEQFGGDPANGELGLFVEINKVAPLGNKDLPMLEKIDPENVVITLTQPVCSMLSNDCYTYELKIRGDGSGVYSEDDWATIDEMTNTITHTFSVTDEELTKVLKEFDDIGYLNLNDDYNSYNVSDMGSITTSITTPTFRKSIFHYYGDSSAPHGLGQLEENIDELRKGLGHQAR